MKNLHKAQFIGISLVALLLAGCSGNQPSQDQSSDTTTTDTTAQTQQSQQTATTLPPDGWTLHMTAKKLFPGNPDMTVNKYCKSVVGDMMECQIYDGNEGDSRLVGVESIVSPQMYNTFTQDEKKLWMPTKDLMQTTMTAMPELDADQFTNVATSMSNNYSKIYLLWDPGKLNLPIGSPVVTVMNTTVATGTTSNTATPPAGANPATPGATPPSQPTAVAPAPSNPAGFTLATFDLNKMIAVGLTDKKGNFEDSVLQRNNAGSLELYKLKNNIGSHTYANTTQMIYIVSGSGEFTIGGKKQKVSSGMIVIIPAGTTQAFQNLGGTTSPLVFVTFKTPFDDTNVAWQ